MRPGRTQLVFVETPANPALSLTDIEAVAAIPGPFTVVDSTFATPSCSSRSTTAPTSCSTPPPRASPATTTRCSGVVAGSRDLIDAVWGWHVVQGGQASPFDAWNGLRGIRTLAVRVRQQCATAAGAGRAPRGSTRRSRAVSYPGLDSHPQRDLAKRQMTAGGTLLAVELAGGARGGPPVLRRRPGGPHRPVARRARDAGDPPGLDRRRTCTPDERAELGITDGLVRISVGLEHVDDLIADLDQALDAAAGPAAERAAGPAGRRERWPARSVPALAGQIRR